MDFRRLWVAGLITNFGSFLTFVALPVQMKELTGSVVAVGAIGAVELVPLIVFGLYGGALADALDKRALILWSEAGQGLLCAGLLVNALLPEPLVWPLYLVAALSSALVAVQRPALDSIVPRIVPHEHLPAAAALNSLRWTVGGVAAPALAGVVVAYAGLGWAYAADLATFVASVALAVGLAPSPASHEAARPSLRSIVEGARYAWSRKELLGTYAVDLAAMFLAMPLALLPFLADELDAEWSLGLMYAALPAGALLVTLTSGWASRVHRHGRMVVLAAMLWGLSVMAAGLVRDVWLVLAFLVLGVRSTWSAGSSGPRCGIRPFRMSCGGGWRGSSCCRTPSGLSWGRCGPGAWRRGRPYGRPCGPVGCCAWGRWGCWRCACRS